MADDDRVKECPECKAAGKVTTFEGEQASMRLGAHRRREHGVIGASARTVRRRRADKAPKARAPREPSLKADLRKTFQVVGTVVGVVDPYCGGVLVDHSGPFSDALARIANEDPRVKRILAALGKAGPYGALLVAAGELAIPIAAHHGLIAPELTHVIGVAPPPARATRRGRPPKSARDADGDGQGEPVSSPIVELD